jgi:citrate lyase subunit beta / citryl-CoA lyase
MKDGALEDFGPAVLFCPGDRPDRFQKAADAADNAILDLEDGAAPANRDMARDAIVAFLQQNDALVAVRINHPTTARGLADAEAVLAAGARILLLPKTESAKEIDAVAALGESALIATIESARGAQAMREILAHPAVWAVSWGPYDLAGDMGMRRVRDDHHRLLTPLATVRDLLIVNAAAERKIAIDTVTAEIRNLDLLVREAEEAASLGFQAKLSIHPSQIPGIRSAFRPSDAEVDHARRMIEASAGLGAFSFEGEMVDEPILRRARRVIAAAERGTPRS